MTAEKLHDAISLLSTDLIAEADKVRSAPRAPIRWQRYAAMAASLVLVICGSLWCAAMFASGGAKETAAEAPAAMQAAVPEMADVYNAFRETQAAAKENADAAEALPEEVPMEAAGENAAAEDSSSAVSGGSGERAACYASTPTVTISAGGETYTLTSPEKKTVADILSSLTYLPENVCECIAEITIMVNGESRFYINLEEGFVRCGLGQASLTDDQIHSLKQIIDDLINAA